MTSNPGYGIERPPEFREIERRFVDFQVQYKQGTIDAAAYQSAVQSLTIRDAAGITWWYGGDPPGWHWHDGTKWSRGEPATQAAARKPRRRTGLLVGLGLGLAGGLCMLSTAVVLISGYQEFQAMPKLVEAVEPQVDALPPVPLSDQQQAIRDQLGPPDAFTILFYEEELGNGSFGDVRFETWSYYSQGREFTFFNGDLEVEAPIDIEVGKPIPIPYTPEQFRAYMSLEEVIAAAGLDAFLVVPLEKELVKGGEVFYADELTFGLKDDELLYVEALALEGGE
jgi:hypothetical protein